MTMDETIAKKLDRLDDILTEMGSVLIAFSGGVDSSFLVAAAERALGDRVIAATATSPLYTDEEIDDAREVIQQVGVSHIIFESDELAAPEFADNPPNRCYHCKKELFSELLDLAEQEGMACVAHAAQTDDLSDHRPGFKAARELGVRAPLMEAGLTKDEIRTISKKWGLPTWDKPAMACLASRFVYGERISSPKLRQVEQVERALRKRGFNQCRVRHHGDIARIEVPADRIDDLTAEPVRSQIAEACTTVGFTYATADLIGYRQGSMNEVLDRETAEES